MTPAWIQPLATLIIGAIAAVIAIYAFRYNYRVSVEKILLDRNKHIQDWGDKVIIGLAEAIALTYRDPAKDEKFFNSRNRAIALFSALVDQGRLFFPNEFPEALGPEKHEAFRGLRRPILNATIAAFEAAKRLDYKVQVNNLAVRGELVEVKRRFTSELQKAIDPRSFTARLANLAGGAETRRQGKEKL